MSFMMYSTEKRLYILCLQGQVVAACSFCNKVQAEQFFAKHNHYELSHGAKLFMEMK